MNPLGGQNVGGTAPAKRLCPRAARPVRQVEAVELGLGHARVGDGEDLDLVAGPALRPDGQHLPRAGEVELLDAVE
jgi:hypothetical protein